jgi:hypothetical protein
MAGMALRLCGPAPPLRDLWESRVRLARGVARVAAAVLEASLEDLHRLATPDVRPLVRRRAGRAVGPRMRVPAPPRRCAMPPGIPAGPPPPGVHAIVRHTLPRDRVERTACGASCENPMRFHTFAYSRCAGPVGTPRARRAPAWAFSVHVVVRRPDGDPLCVRCGRLTRATAAARVGRARCVARVLDDGPEDVDWGAVLLFLAGRSGWGMPPGRAGGGERRWMAPVGPPRPRPPPPPRRVGRRVLVLLGGGFLSPSRCLGGLGAVVGLRNPRRALPPAPLPRVPRGGGGQGGCARPPTPQIWRPILQVWGVGSWAPRPSRRLGARGLAQDPVAGGGAAGSPPPATPGRRLPTRPLRGPRVRGRRPGRGNPAGKAREGPGPVVLRTHTLGWWVWSTAARGFASCAFPVGFSCPRPSAPGLGRWLPPRLLSFCAFDPSLGWTPRKFRS